MKILCAPDLHCWWNTYEKTPGSIQPDRLAEWGYVAEELIKGAVTNDVKMAIFPGDYFIESRPHPKAVLKVIRLFEMLRNHDIKVIGIGGNHDDIGPAEIDFVDVISTMDPLWGITSPQVINYDRSEEISIAVLPSMRPSELGSGTVHDVSNRLLEIAGQMYNPDKRNILVGHWGTDQSIYVNGMKADSTREPYLKLDELKKIGYDAVILGHIHKPQVLNSNPLILHTGVLTRGRSDEGNVTCGYYIIDTDDWSYKYFELPARQITHIKFTQEAIEDFVSGAWLGEIPVIKDHIVTVSYTASEEKIRSINHRDIGHALYAAGAYYVDSINPTIIQKERKRNVTVTEKMDELDSFIEWYQSAGEPQELKEEAVKSFSTYLWEAQNGRGA